MTPEAAIVVAVITAVGGVMVAFVNRGRKENKGDHALVMKRLDDVANTVDSLSKLTVNHLKWHQRKKPVRKPKRR